jgi:uncharacterized membrane protein
MVQGFRESNRILGNTSFAVAVCASGRALDFATTWVAVHGHRAAEAKPFASALIQMGGATFGLIAWEFLITTPAVFLGCYLVKHIQARQKSQPQPLTMNCALLYSLGTISTLVAIHNLRFLL